MSSSAPSEDRPGQDAPPPRGRGTGFRIRRFFFVHVANRDEELGRALRRSTVLHVLVILLTAIPAFWQYFGCVKPYKRPPGGKTQPKPRKRVAVKKRIRIIHSLRSDIAFNFPDIENIDLRLDKLTERAYSGRVGAGSGKGKGAGYGGAGGGKVRFIRLKYDGGDWDQDYGLGADVNMLVEFGRRTGIPVAAKTEHVTIRDLMRFPKKLSPPFVYITGERNIHVRDADVKRLRKYLTERGGMIFADNGGGRFHGQFLNLMRRVLPGERFVEIPFDDEVFLKPYSLPGAPPLWHHSGYRALGIRRQGRWVVFYHQGDLGDAWKDGHSGAPAASWQAAYEMGVNVIDYAFRHYLKFLERQ